MRLMIIGIAAFGLAALAMIIADGRLPRSVGIDQLWDGDVKQARFVNTRWAAKQESKELVIPTSQEKWRAMTGFPSYTSFSFPLPKHTPVETGQFILEFKVQLPKSGGGALRVVVNNEKRAELLFDPNQQKYRAVIALTDRELAAAVIDIALSADGHGVRGECSDNRSRAVIIEISPKTRLELDLKEPLTDLSDIALLAGTPLRIVSPEADNQLARERALALALVLRQRGDNVAFDTPTEKSVLTLRVDPKTKKPRYDQKTNQLILSGPRHLDDVFPNSTAAHLNSGQNVSVDALGAMTYARQFSHEVHWRIDFDLKDMPGGKAPTELDLALFRSITDENASSILTVSLNDTLLYSGGLKGRNNPLKSAYKLPPDEIELHNTLEISLNANEDRIGVCNPGRNGFAQLLKSSSVSELETPNLKFEVGLPYQLAQFTDLRIMLPRHLTKTQLNEGLSFMERILPPNTKLLTSKRSSQSPIAEGIVIPIARLREDYDKLVSLDSNDEKRELWIAVNNNRNKVEYKLLTRELANKVLASRSLGAALILSLPTTAQRSESAQ